MNRCSIRGGGRTEIDLDLLFDTSLAGSSIRTEDVRDLTRPLWELAENGTGPDGYGRPPVVRFVWGKAWNIRAVVAAVAERLERFTRGGAPSRSFLRMRLLRTVEPAVATFEEPEQALEPAPLPPGLLERLSDSSFEFQFHALLGGGVLSERLDQLAQRYYGNPALWRLIAAANRIIEPLNLSFEVDLALRIPSLRSILRGP